MKLRNFRESTASNCNAKFWVVLKLGLVEVEKKIFFKPKITPSYIFNLNGSTLRSESCLAELKGLKESNALNRKEESPAVLKFRLVEF